MTARDRELCGFHCAKGSDCRDCSPVRRVLEVEEDLTKTVFS